MSTGDKPSWQSRFRVPLVRGMQVAAGAPARGLVASNASGIFQLHAWDLPGGRLRKLTNRSNGTVAGLLGPDGRYVYYHDDVGGNELGHYVRIPFEGGAPEDITPGVPPYPTFGLAASGAGNRFGFVTADEAGFHLQVIDAQEDGTLGPLRRVHSSARVFDGPVFSHDGAIAQLAASTGARSLRFGLVALNAATGQFIGELGDDDSRLVPVAFAPISGDTRLLAFSNRSGSARPLVWDVASGARVDIALDGQEGEIYPVDWSPDGRRVLLVQIARAVHRLHVYDLAEEALTPLRHPNGTYEHVHFAPDGTIPVLWEDSTHPPQVIALDALTGAVLRTLLPTPDVAPCRPWRSVGFSSTDGQEIQGWLALPDGAGPFPAILHVHGGPEAATTEIFAPACQSWLDHGFAFLSINYRGSTTFGRAFLEQIWGNVGRLEVEDMIAAREWLVREGIADPARVFATGWSYGGYLTLQALGTKPDLWAGGMAGIAVADWAIAHEDTTDTLRGIRAARFGGTPQEQPERYAASSPITYAQNVKAPVIIVQGRKDTRTPPRSVEAYEARMKSLGKPIEVHWFDAGHGSLAMDQAIQHHELMLRFASRISQGVESKIKALLFDLGGVVIDIDFERAFRGWQSISQLSFDEIRRAFKFDTPYEKHERGEIAWPEYLVHLRAVLKLEGSDAEIVEGWNTIFVREIRETLELIRSVRAVVPCYAFTNTNPTHQGAWTAMAPGVVQSFDRVFASHEIGLRKPEKRAFEHIAAAIGVPPSSILFFDDLLENVEGARAAGLMAVHVRGPADVRDALRQEGMIAE